MPFGLAMAGATYIKLMRRVLDGLSNVSVYFDNIYVYAQTLEEHLVALEKVLKRLRDLGLGTNPSKCNFCFYEIAYLGFSVGSNVIHPLSDKIEAIQKVTPPKTKKELWSFLGMINFYWKFIPHLSDSLVKFTNLLKKGTREPLTWTPDLKSTSHEVKTHLSKLPILQLPDLSKTFSIRTGASSEGLGGVLFQYWDGIPLPVSYARQKLLSREKNYSTVERELLGLKWAVSKFRYFLYGREFIVETDHKPLQYLEKFKGSNGHLMRWALSLQPYRYRIVYISGSENHGADFLSKNVW